MRAAILVALLVLGAGIIAAPTVAADGPDDACVHTTTSELRPGASIDFAACERAVFGETGTATT